MSGSMPPPLFLSSRFSMLEDDRHDVFSQCMIVSRCTFVRPVTVAFPCATVTTPGRFPGQAKLRDGHLPKQAGNIHLVEKEERITLQNCVRTV